MQGSLKTKNHGLWIFLLKDSRHGPQTTGPFPKLSVGRLTPGFLYSFGKVAGYHLLSSYREEL